ncbi:MAG: integrase arm-type DNA-binding domain-containing protein, partial [Zoogloeaceae bacterium]|nr:integrase arm-type DNA-binding domain-containing protein [Zoogloeaceae bacterium]
MLTDTAVKSAKPGAKPVRLYDSGGLYLEVSPAGGKLWRMKCYFRGKEKRLSLGRYPGIGLREARERRDEARKMLAGGNEPLSPRQAAKFEQEKAQQALLVEEANTLLNVARDWREVWQTYVAPTTNKSVWANLERNIFPDLGAMPIASVTTGVLLATLRKLEAAGKGDTLRKATGALNLLFKWAKRNGRGVTENPVDFDRYTFKKFETTNHPAIIDLPGIARLLRNIDAYHGKLPGVSAALRLAPLLFQRIGELRTMKWADLDLDGQEPEWNYFVTKIKVEHNVPLARQAVEILKELHPMTGGGEYVFPSFRTGRPISDAAINTALKTMGYDTQKEMTGHGFRAIGYTHLRQTLRYPADIVNFQLSH